MKMTLTGMGALASLLIGMSGDALADTDGPAAVVLGTLTGQDREGTTGGASRDQR